MVSCNNNEAKLLLLFSFFWRIITIIISFSFQTSHMHIVANTCASLSCDSFSFRFPLICRLRLVSLFHLMHHFVGFIPARAQYHCHYNLLADFCCCYYCIGSFPVWERVRDIDQWECARGSRDGEMWSFGPLT